MKRRRQKGPGPFSLKRGLAPFASSVGLLAMTMIFICASARAGEAKSPEVIFQEANAAYRGGDYVRAAQLYESLVNRNWRNGHVFYNLGNAYFRQKLLGRAILNYEKARRLDPRDPDLAANLAYTRKLLEYRVEDKRNWYLRASESFLNFFTQAEMGLISLFWGLLFWIGWAVSLYLRPRSPWGWQRKALLLIAATCLTLH